MRDDVFMLGRDSTVKDHRLAIIRSSSALVVSSQNNNREWVYSQEQTVSWEGYSGQAFNPHFPHNDQRRGTTKNCTDCHLSAQAGQQRDHGAVARLRHRQREFLRALRLRRRGRRGLLRHCLDGSRRNRRRRSAATCSASRYPRDYQAHLANNRLLKEAYHHDSLNVFGDHLVQDVTLRGEYLYTAAGSGGLEVDDVAEIDQKGFSQRVTSAPVSPLGQRTYVRTPYATSVALPSTLMEDPEAQANAGQRGVRPIHPLYNYVYVTDLKEGPRRRRCVVPVQRRSAGQLPAQGRRLQSGPQARWRDEGVCGGTVSLRGVRARH